MANPTGAQLRALFVDEACEVMYGAFDQARRDMDGWADMPATWPVLPEPERQAARAAVGTLIDWLNSRRF